MRKTTPMNTAGNFLKFMFRFKQAMKFPGTQWFVPAWGAVARSYRRKQEGRWVDAVEKNVLNPSKSGACFMGWAALGQPTHTNSLETGNRWLKKELREWLQIESPAATLPTSLTLLVRALAALWPKWSADDAERGQYHKPSTDELCSQKNFRSQLDVKGSLVLRLNGDAGAKSCFAFGQKTKVGPLHKISLKTAKAAAALWEQGLPTSMALRDFKVMVSVLFTFTSADACFPCWTWGNKEAVTTYAVRDFPRTPVARGPPQAEADKSRWARPSAQTQGSSLLR